MNDYQKEQLDALRLVRTHLPPLKETLLETLHAALTDYAAFRRETDRFLKNHFSSICSAGCYQSRLSACCTKDGIITFFADVIINVLNSPETALDKLEARLHIDNTGHKCVYLAEDGCLWETKPIVCQMFLCDNAQQEIFGSNPELGAQWKGLRERKKEFTWPDRPVLFDGIESIFLEKGFTSSLMYLHNSPGLLRIKRQAGPIRK